MHQRRGSIAGIVMGGVLLGVSALAPGVASAQTTSTSTTTSSMFSTFSDVNAQTPNANAIEALTALGLVNGMTPTTYAPTANLTRAEFAKLVDIAVGYGPAANLLQDQATPFKDVPQGQWFTGYIAIAYAKGFIKGEGNGIFAPDANVTYAQALAILVRALGYAPAVPPHSYPNGDVEEAATLGIINGVSATSINNPIDRAAAAGLIWNALKTKVGVASGSGSTETVTPSNQILLNQGLGYSLVYAGDSFSAAPASDANVVTAVNSTGLTVNGENLRFASGAKVVNATSLAGLLGMQISYVTNREGQLLLVEDVTPSSQVLTGTVSSATTTGLTLTPQNGTPQNLSWAPTATTSNGGGDVVNVNGSPTYVNFTPFVSVNGEPLSLSSVAQIDNTTVTLVTDASGNIISLTAANAAQNSGVITAVGTSGFNRTITLNNTTTYTLDPTATVTLNGQPSTVDALAAGEVASISVDYNNLNQPLNTVNHVAAVNTGISGTLTSVQLGAQNSVTVNGVNYALASNAMVWNGGQFTPVSSGINGVVGFPVTIIMGSGNTVALIELSQSSLGEGIVEGQPVMPTAYSSGSITIFGLGGHVHTYTIPPNTSIQLPPTDSFVQVHLNQNGQVAYLQQTSPSGTNPTPLQLSNIVPSVNGTFTATVQGGGQQTFVLALDAPVILSQNGTSDTLGNLSQIGSGSSGFAYVNSSATAQVDLLVVTTATAQTQTEEVLVTGYSATPQNGQTVYTVTAIGPSGTQTLSTTNQAYVPFPVAVAEVQVAGTTLESAPNYVTPTAYASAPSSTTGGSFVQNGVTYYGVQIIPGQSSFTAGGQTFYVSPQTVFVNGRTDQTVSFSSLSSADAVVVWSSGSPAVAQFVVVTQ